MNAAAFKIAYGAHDGYGAMRKVFERLYKDAIDRVSRLARLQQEWGARSAEEMWRILESLQDPDIPLLLSKCLLEASRPAATQATLDPPAGLKSAAAPPAVGAVVGFERQMRDQKVRW